MRGASVAGAAQIRVHPTEPVTSAPSGTHGNSRRAGDDAVGQHVHPEIPRGILLAVVVLI
ncbi:hypothetical protein [Candidatus Mycobacterium methanotrophicum]|uniref:Uncharacterized protein n=1 Tax=Candidatus Mycobacterium methanotrophicum TaxID=2943498 RepID=A0ABY4QTP4_9MYCO|nr:hypothetical protein [Candidatus Mycobacterium methanotrophicum]UQX13461.1 hypothetical protein M5I08_24980 [Candidatus Mycobacterium methanotrophicum]